MSQTIQPPESGDVTDVRHDPAHPAPTTPGPARKPRARTRKPTPEASSSPWGVLSRVVDAVRRLKPAQQAGILSLVVLVVALAVTLPLIDDDTPTLAIVVVGLVCGTVPMVTHARAGLPSAIAVFAFTLTSLFLLRPSRVEVEAPNAKSDADTTRIPVYGTVFDVGQSKVVRGANVGVSGFGEATATTGPMGAFRLEVPRYILRNDSVEMIVQFVTDAMFSRSLRERPYRLDINASPPVALGGAQPRPVLAARINVPPPSAQQQGRVDLRIVVDSIRTLTPGTTGARSWEFEVEVEDNGDYHVPKAVYSSAAGRSLMLVAGERRFRVPARGVLELGIEGKSQRNMVSSYRVSGAVYVRVDSLRPNTPVPARVEAVAPNPRDGRFLVYMTVIRQAPAPPVVVQRQRNQQQRQ